MRKNIFFILNTTALFQYYQIHSRRVSEHQNRSKIVKTTPASRDGTTALLIYQGLEVPFLSEADLSDHNTEIAPRLTRHIRKDLLEITLEGSYKFGTISEYRPKDEEQIGRLSDRDEGSQFEVYSAQDETYSGEVGGHSINIRIFGAENPLAVETVVNDYCSCLSFGDFNMYRATQIRELGNPELGAYVVYDAKKLFAAIECILQEKTHFSRFRIVARTVKYESKNKRLEIEGRLPSASGRDVIRDWIEIVFTKPVEYAHEEEVRIVLVDPNQAGNLPHATKYEIFKDNRIAESIESHGLF